MRAYYATYNNTIYQLVGDNRVPRDIMNTVEHSHSEVSHMKDTGMTNVHIIISNVDRSSDSNADLYSSVVAKLKTDKTKTIDKLSPIYRIYAEYSLVDENAGRVVDQGVCINELKGSTFIFPLGINDDNEFVSRLGISLNPSFEKCYRDVKPFGITRSNDRYNLTLHIQRIYIIQILDSALTPVSTPDTQEFIPYVDHGMLPPHWNCTAHNVRGKYPDPAHPSIPSMLPVSTQINLTEKDCAVVYDSASDGLVIDAVPIRYNLRRIRIDIDFDFLDILVAAEEDIEKVLTENSKEENAGSDSDTVVTTPSEDGTKDTESKGDSTPTTNSDAKDDQTGSSTENPEGNKEQTSTTGSEESAGKTE